MDDFDIVAGEVVAQQRHPLGVELHRDDARAGSDQRAGQRAVAGPEVDDELARANAGGPYDPRRGIRGEPVEAPVRAMCRRRPRRGHGGPSP